MSSKELLTALDSLGSPRILVLGDLILDRYCWGDAERVSQEAPVVVLRAEQQEARLGGAGNVCNMLRGLEAQVTCASVLGSDAAAEEAAQLLETAGVDTSCLFRDHERPTTVKERFIGRAAGKHPHQMLRVDREVRRPLGNAQQIELAGRVIDVLRRHDVVIVSDYAKGVCSQGVLQPVLAAARELGVPVLVDPSRGGDFSRYYGATTMTPNRLEAELATGGRIERPEDAFAVGQELCRRCGLQMAIITLDRDGMALVWPDGRGELFPTQVRAVYDITGAGDMVISMIGACLAAGVAPDLAVRLGNVAAGLEVEQIGVVVVRREEIRERLQSLSGGMSQKVVTLAQAERLRELHRLRGQRAVFTNGCFDLLHVGHVQYLAEAKTLGDLLIVGVNSDASVRKLKGPSRPVIGEQDRAAMLAALAAVDLVLVFDDDTPHELLRRLRPEVLVKGGTYAPHEVVGREVVEAYGGQVCVTGAIDGISTTRILASVEERARQTIPLETMPRRKSPPAA